MPPARVVILGAGTVGSAAARTAVATGARVMVFDNEPRQLRRVMEHVRGVEMGRRTPHVVNRAMVESMKPGSAVMDVSIDQGGCIETGRLTGCAEPARGVYRL